MKGHLLVIPKRHVERPAELTKDELSEMMDVVIKYQEKLLKLYWGCDVRQNCRPKQPQSKYKVDHVHIHLQPRELEDELYKKVQKHQIEVFADLPDSEIKEMRKELS
jgi:diadenosine tetraphosphate (Ap4A) HIT family hydrolase